MLSHCIHPSQAAEVILLWHRRAPSGTLITSRKGPGKGRIQHPVSSVPPTLRPYYLVSLCVDCHEYKITSHLSSPLTITSQKYDLKCSLVSPRSLVNIFQHFIKYFYSSPGDCLHTTEWPGAGGGRQQTSAQLILTSYRRGRLRPHSRPATPRNNPRTGPRLAN